MEARLNTEQKELFRLAAGLEGQTVTDFIIAAAQLAAGRAIERHKIRINKAAKFYEHFAFRRFEADDLRLYLPMTEIARLVELP